MIVFGHFPRARRTVGMIGTTWCVAEGGRVSTIDEGPRAFVSLLEENRAELESLLRDGLAREGLPAPLLESFPFAAVIELALTHLGEYWIDRALEWVEGRELPPSIVPVIERMIAEKRGTQQQRHRARNLLRTNQV